jgi:hypothetical protein
MSLNWSRKGNQGWVRGFSPALNKGKKDVYASGAHSLIIPQQSEIDRVLAFREQINYWVKLVKYRGKSRG